MRYCTSDFIYNIHIEVLHVSECFISVCLFCLSVAMSSDAFIYSSLGLFCFLLFILIYSIPCYFFSSILSIHCYRNRSALCHRLHHAVKFSHSLTGRRRNYRHQFFFRLAVVVPVDAEYNSNI